FGPEPFKNLTARSARGFGEAGELEGAEISCDCRRHGARPRPARADFDPGRLGKCGLIGTHEFGRPREARQGDGLESGAPEVEAWLAVPIYEALHVFRRATHRTRSHSFASVIASDFSVVSAAIITILPVLSISIRAICTPAAVTALTALVTSSCRNVDGARPMASYREAWLRRC